MWEATLPDEFTHSVLTLISRTKSSLTSLLHLYTISHCHYPQKSCWEWAWEGRWERCRKGIRMNSLFYTVHTCFSTVTSRILHPVAKQNNSSIVLSVVNAGPDPQQSVKIKFVDIVNKLISQMKRHSVLNCHLFNWILDDFTTISPS